MTENRFWELKQSLMATGLNSDINTPYSQDLLAQGELASCVPYISGSE